jgi:hypothetical protein
MRSLTTFSPSDNSAYNGPAAGIQAISYFGRSAVRAATSGCSGRSSRERKLAGFSLLLVYPPFHRQSPYTERGKGEVERTPVPFSARPPLRVAARRHRKSRGGSLTCRREWPGGMVTLWRGHANGRIPPYCSLKYPPVLRHRPHRCRETCEGPGFREGIPALAHLFRLSIVD